MRIDEIDGSVSSINTTIDNAFAIIPLIYTTGSNWIHLNCNKELIEKVYITPKSILSKVSISLMTKNGNLFNFGSGNGYAIQNDFVFKITTFEKSRNQINIRSVF